MPRVAAQIQLTNEEKKELIKNINSQVVERRIYLRSKIILLSAENKQCIEIAKILGISEKTCRKWRNRFARDRLNGLYDLKRSGAPEIFNEIEKQEIIQMACEAPKILENWTLANLTERVKKRYNRNVSIESIRMILKMANSSDVNNIKNKKVLKSE